MYTNVDKITYGQLQVTYYYDNNNSFLGLKLKKNLCIDVCNTYTHSFYMNNYDIWNIYDNGEYIQNLLLQKSKPLQVSCPNQCTKTLGLLCEEIVRWVKW